MMDYQNRKRNKIIVSVLAIFTFSALIGLTYAFFSANVSNTNHEVITSNSATLSLVFDDNDNGISANLNLEESVTKKFTIENTGTADAFGSINWYNLYNTYGATSLEYNLEKSETENGTYTSIGSGYVPTASSLTTTVLKEDILVPYGQTYYYRLTITLKNLDENQNSDITAKMYLRCIHTLI